MSVGILHDREQQKACLFDNVSDGAFGPVLEGELCHFAEAFIEHVRTETGLDPRDVPGNKLMRLYEEWRDKLTETIAEAA